MLSTWSQPKFCLFGKELRAHYMYFCGKLKNLTGVQVLILAVTQTKPELLTGSVSVTFSGFCLVTHQACIRVMQCYLSIIRFATPTSASTLRVFSCNTYCKPIRNHVRDLVSARNLESPSSILHFMALSH